MKKIIFIAAAFSTRNRAVLRLRKTDEKTTLTYKESISSERDVKNKLEFETEVADVDAMEEIIRMLGYRLSIVYRNTAGHGISTASRSCSTSFHSDCTWRSKGRPGASHGLKRNWASKT